MHRAVLLVDWGGRMVDAETFANACVSEWDRFLREKKLLDPEAVITVCLNDTAYSLLRAAVVHLPVTDPRWTAISSAIRLFGGTSWEVKCLPVVGHGFCECLKRTAEWYVTQPNVESRAGACRSAAQVIAEGLAGQASSPDSN